MTFTRTSHPSISYHFSRRGKKDLPFFPASCVQGSNNVLEIHSKPAGGGAGLCQFHLVPAWSKVVKFFMGSLEEDYL